MTEATLVAIITVICGGTVPAVSKSTIEVRMDCYEKLVNCSVGPNGLIMTFNDFNQKCVNGKK